MSTQGRDTDALQIELQIPGDAYRTLVAELRQDDPSRPQSRGYSRRVRTLIDIDIPRRAFSVRTVGNHRLPRPLTIRTDSETHTNLAHMIIQSLGNTFDPEVIAALKGIVNSCPEVLVTSLRVKPRDLELAPTNPRQNPLTPSTPRLLGTVTPTIFLDIDDAPTLVITETPIDETAENVARLRDNLRVTNATQAKVIENFVEVFASIAIPNTLSLPVTFFAHWGSYDDLAPSWRDEELSRHEPSANGRTLSLYFRAHVPTSGWYGATFFAQIAGSPERVWIGGGPADDARFFISSDDSALITSRLALINAAREEARIFIKDSVSNPPDIESAARKLSLIQPNLSLGGLIEEHVSSNPDEEHALTSLLQDCPESIAEAIAQQYGVGEIVFATPEGPQAAAGGLAQVITGLPPLLCQRGIPVSIITPLYRYDNGNKHPDAETTLRHGILLRGHKVIPRYIGTVTVHIGPTYHPGTAWTRRAASTLPFKVYLAQYENLRVFLLANNSIFDRVYQPVYADEQLRRAIAFSRAAIETTMAPHFDIRPSAIISNDWMTACIPSFCALDQRYRNDPILQRCKTIHMIHNGGADYHGRIPCHSRQEDLWPMFNLAPEHFFGFRDPHRGDLLNFTIAASEHATGGVVTVSRPYARQIASPGGGDGLETVLTRRTKSVFGVSNGIDRAQIDAYLSMISGESTELLRQPTTLLATKNRAKESIQARYGLSVEPNATLVSFVGRLAEQKGLHLLSGFVNGSDQSTLESIVSSNHDTQILVAGPLTSGDPSSDAIRNTLDYLRVKYPGRVAAAFDYIPHATALEMMFASNLFLMPSRFEPGGITQLEALAAGTLVVGRNVGGISATIENFNPVTGSGNGFLCNDYCPTAFANTTRWALSVIRDQKMRARLVSQAIHAPHSWADRAPTFVAVLQRIILGAERFQNLSALHASRARVSTASV